MCFKVHLQHPGNEPTEPPTCTTDTGCVPQTGPKPNLSSLYLHSLARPLQTAQPIHNLICASHLTFFLKITSTSGSAEFMFGSDDITDVLWIPSQGKFKAEGAGGTWGSQEWGPGLGFSQLLSRGLSNVQVLLWKLWQEPLFLFKY